VEQHRVNKLCFHQYQQHEIAYLFNAAADVTKLNESSSTRWMKKSGVFVLELETFSAEIFHPQSYNFFALTFDSCFFKIIFETK
jgi:hypothetical protein